MANAECDGVRGGTTRGACASRALRLLAVVAAISAGQAFAAPSCRNLASTGVSFGAYNPLSTLPLDSVGTITYDCPPPAAPVITLSSGSSPTYAPRLMQGPDTLQYNLFLDAARTIVWGNGSGGTSLLNGPQGNGMTVPVYGRIYPQQNAAAGLYGDAVIVTINF
jgi:spore coat protein U-like protein